MPDFEKQSTESIHKVLEVLTPYADRIRLDNNQTQALIDQIALQQAVVHNVLEKSLAEMRSMTVADHDEFDDLIAEAKKLETAAKAKPFIKIERPPGYQLFGFFSTFCSKKFVERELSALLADGNAQYQELLLQGNVRGARRWKWAMRVHMVATVFRGGLGALLGLVRIKAQSSE
jgi:hypothetical protein